MEERKRGREEERKNERVRELNIEAEVEGIMREDENER